ncbi:ZIP family metal transporter [Salinisphaera aquimarina]|uniref:ZIP family metal transporter n=1 Tax=Salinisphaera aquimarina TaxID=2094031 RepID=A0ABV7EU13_9GAMM
MYVQPLLYTLIPVAAAALSGAVAAVRVPGEQATSAVQHLAAGVVFAAAAIELVPGVLHSAPLPAIIGFALGIVVMFALRHLSDAAERRAERRGLPLSIGLIVTIGIDFFIDGVVLGAGFTNDSQTGILLTIAITLEYLFVGLSVAATLPTRAPWALIALPTGLALFTIGGTALGVAMLTGASKPVTAAVLAFGAVVFMYLVTEELLVKAHEQGDTAFGSATFFVGFLCYLLIEQALAT